MARDVIPRGIPGDLYRRATPNYVSSEGLSPSQVRAINRVIPETSLTDSAGEAVSDLARHIIPFDEEIFGKDELDMTRAAVAERLRRRNIASREAGDPIVREGEHVLSTGSISRGAATLIGSMAGAAVSDPTTYISPGKTALQRIVSQSAISGLADYAGQRSDVSQGIQDEVDLTQTAINTVVGAGGQTLGELGSAAAKAIRDRRTRAGILPEETPEAPVVDRRTPRTPEEEAAYQGARRRVADEYRIPEERISVAEAEPDFQLRVRTDLNQRGRDQGIVDRPAAFYRETSPDRAREVFPTTSDNPQGLGGDHTFLSDAPELARGQGNNTGVFLEFDRNGLEVRPYRKPGQSPELREQGQEFVGNNPPEAYSGSLNRVTVSKARMEEAAAEMAKYDYAGRGISSGFIRDLEELEAAGWARTNNPDGSVSLARNPSRAVEQQPSQPAQGGLLMQQQKGAPPRDPNEPELPLNETRPPRAERQNGEPVPRAEPQPRETLDTADLEAIRSTADIPAAMDALSRRIPKNKKTRAQMRQEADELGMTEESFLKSRGLEGTEGFTLKAGDILNTVSSQTIDILRREGGLESPTAQLAIARLAAVSEHFENAVSGPAGRNLNVLGAARNTVEASKTLQGAMATPRGRRRVERLLEQYANDPDAIQKIARDAVDPTIRDRIFSFRYNMMLSGPKTHVYNILGNSSNLLVDLAEHGVASVLGVRRRWSNDLDRVTGREMAARITGAIEGARTGLSSMRQAFKEGRPMDDASRAETHRGRVGSWELPVKSLAAEDEFFRSVAYASNLHGEAVRTAIREGLTGESLKRRIAALIQKPTKEMVASTENYAKRMRFQDDPSFLGRAIENIRTHKKEDALITGLGRDGIALVLPFVRTPDSLIRTAARRSPLGLFSTTNRDDFRAGGARRDTAIARVAMGTGVTAYIAMNVLDGVITGEGPRDYKQRQALELTGWQPNSIKVGDEYYSYEGLEPLSHLLSGTATLMERHNEDSGASYLTKAANMVADTAETLTNSSWAEGLSDLFAALNAPESQRQAAINTFFANIATSFVVPAVSRQANQAFFDPVTRDTRGDDSIEDKIAGRIQSGIPGLSDNLPAQLDALGRPIGRGDAIGPDFLSRMAPSLAEDSPLAVELVRLMESHPKLAIQLDRVPRSVNTADFPIGRLTALEHHNYQLATGAFFTAMMEEEMASPDWQGMDDDARRDVIKEVAADARRFAREEVFSAPEDSGEEDVSQPAPSEEEGEEFTAGIPTSMGRTVEGNRAVGGVEGSAHIGGNGIDFVPAPGVSWEQLVQETQDFFGAQAKVLHEYRGTRREHVHVEMEGLNAPLYGERGSR
jgi:hypothetical protein